MAVIPGVAHAADVTMTVSDAINTTSFNTGLNWSNGQPPSAGNNYIVNATAANVNLRTPADFATALTFAGDSLTLNGASPTINAFLTIKTLTGVTTTVNNLTLNAGRIQNGANAAGIATTATFASNLITLGALGGFFDAGTGGRVLNVIAPVTGTGGLLTLVTNGGTINYSGVLSGTGGLTANSNGGFTGITGVNTYTGPTIITGSTISGGAVAGAVRANDGVGISAASALTLNSGNLETGADITRGLGTGAGQISIVGAASGFAAVGAPVTIALGGLASPTPLTWGSADFNPGTLTLADFNSNNTLNFANPIDNGGAARTILAASGTTTNVATVSGAITGTGAMTFNGYSTLAVTGANTYTGTTTLTGSRIVLGVQTGSVRATDGVGIPTGSALSLNSGILATGTNFTRTVGTDAGQISVVGAASGFSAVDAPVTIALGGTATPTPLVWGSAAFNPTVLVLNDATANNTLTFANPIDTNGASRTIFSSAGTAATQSVITGAITGTGGMSFFGNSTTVLANTNTYAGDTIIGRFFSSGTQATNGIVRVAANGALGLGTVTIGLDGNGVLSRLELSGNSTLSNPIILPSRNTTAIALQNVSGTNTLAGTIGITSGGNTNIIQSDAGLLTLSGSGSIASPGVALQSLLGARIVTLQGAGNGQISGIVRDNNGTAGPTIGLTKAGTGTWTLTNANTYTGPTLVSGGTLALGNGGTFGTANVTNNATVGFSNTAALSVASVITGTGGITQSGTGTTTVTAANTYTGTTTTTAGVLVLTTPAQSPVLTGAGGADVQGGRLVLNYAGGSSPVAQVKTALDAAYPAGFLTGQIRSSTLIAGRTLGYGDSGSAVTVRVTLPGDADLDGDVDFNDFLNLQTNFGASGTRFDQGNFNYDGATDFNDFLALQTNFGGSVGGSAVAFSSEQVAAITAFGMNPLNQAVPEPASLALLGLGAAGLLRRRR